MALSEARRYAGEIEDQDIDQQLRNLEALAIERLYIARDHEAEIAPHFLGGIPVRND
jgi:hypothetical protein